MRGVRLVRGAVAELAVEALVVPPPHPFQGGQLDLLDGTPRTAASDQLGFEQAVDGLGQGIVERVADRTC
jgi:hypothetical protein